MEQTSPDLKEQTYQQRPRGVLTPPHPTQNLNRVPTDTPTQGSPTEEAEGGPWEQGWKPATPARPPPRPV